MVGVARAGQALGCTEALFTLGAHGGVCGDVDWVLWWRGGAAKGAPGRRSSAPFCCLCSVRGLMLA
eukprot:359768-Chlamydomonas_euryale.AAC.13